VASFRGATTAVVLASVAAAGTQASILLLGFWILGVPAALLGAGSAFVLAWIPTVGTLPVWAGAAVWLYLEGSTPKAVAMVVIGLVVGLVDNVVRPLVLRGRQEMHPMISLIAILGGLALMGIPGLFLGPLFASMTIAVLEIWPAVAAWCGIPVTDAGVDVPDVPMIPRTP
jgi:predicted PurR-regulated permease PerM